MTDGLIEVLYVTPFAGAFVLQIEQIAPRSGFIPFHPIAREYRLSTTLSALFSSPLFRACTNSDGAGTKRCLLVDGVTMTMISGAADHNGRLRWAWTKRRLKT